MGLKDIFKPAWQSKNAEKATKAIQKLTNEATIYEAALFYINNSKPDFFTAFNRLSNMELIQKAAILYLNDSQRVEFEIEKNIEKINSLFEKAKNAGILHKILSDIKKDNARNRRKFIDYLFANFKPETNHLKYVINRTANNQVKAWAVSILYKNEFPKKIFRFNKEVLETIAQNHASSIAIKENYEQFPHEAKYAILNRKDINRTFLLQQATNADSAALCFLYKEDLKKILNDSDAEKRIEIWQWLKGVKNRKFHSNHIHSFDTEILSIPFLEESKNPEEVLICYDLLHKPETRKRFYKKKQKVDRNIEQFKTNRFFESLFDEYKTKNSFKQRFEYLKHIEKQIKKSHVSQNSLTDRLKKLSKELDSEIINAIENSRKTPEEKLGLHNYITNMNKKESIKNEIYSAILLNDKEKIHQKIEAVKILGNKKISANPTLLSETKSLVERTKLFESKLILLPFLNEKQIETEFENMGSQSKKLQWIEHCQTNMKKTLAEKFIEEYPDFTYSRTESITCPTCNGEGSYNAGMEWRDCQACSGYGYINDREVTYDVYEYFSDILRIVK